MCVGMFNLACGMMYSIGQPVLYVGCITAGRLSLGGTRYINFWQVEFSSRSMGGWEVDAQLVEHLRRSTVLKGRFFMVSITPFLNFDTRRSEH